jgi:hypothetical protein
LAKEKVFMETLERVQGFPMVYKVLLTPGCSRENWVQTGRACAGDPGLCGVENVFREGGSPEVKDLSMIWQSTGTEYQANLLRLFCCGLSKDQDFILLFHLYSLVLYSLFH